jgi:hypothetical protein
MDSMNTSESGWADAPRGTSPVNAVLIGFRLVDLGSGIETERVMYSSEEGFFCVVKGRTIVLVDSGRGHYVPEKQGPNYIGAASFTLNPDDEIGVIWPD